MSLGTPALAASRIERSRMFSSYFKLLYRPIGVFESILCPWDRPDTCPAPISSGLLVWDALGHLRPTWSCCIDLLASLSLVWGFGNN